MTQLFRRSAGFASIPRGGVITIGNFDGVHAGHQALLQQLTEHAHLKEGPSIVMTFEPQPLEYFAAGNPVPRLTDWRQKFTLLAAMGVDVVLMPRFDAQFVALTARQFMQEILWEGLGIREIVTGSDFRFGKGREGTVAMLQGEPHWSVTVLPDTRWEGERISSTRIREALQSARFDLATACLGRPFALEGRVVRGRQRGRQLGFPTANIQVRSRAVPVSGVYAVRVYGASAVLAEGVANVGVRPTVDGTRLLLEVHLFQFDEALYGKRLRVEFCHKLRDERRFDSLDLLKEQIGRDAQDAIDYFRRI